MSKEGVAPTDIDVLELDLETRISINALCDRTRYTHNFEQSRLIEPSLMFHLERGIERVIRDEVWIREIVN